MIDEIKAEVASAYPNDHGRIIARLDPEMLSDLLLRPGDVVVIEGGATTVAKAWRSDRDDWDDALIRIDRFLQHNAESDIGETVTIRKAEVQVVEKVVVTLSPTTTVPFELDIANNIKRQLLKRPIQADGIVPVSPDQSEPIPLVITETVPDDIVRITDTTSVELRLTSDEDSTFF